MNRATTHKTHILLPALAVAIVLAATGVVVAAVTGTTSKKAPTKAFIVRGSVTKQLTPGARATLKLRVTNRTSATISVTKLRVRISIDAAHKRAGCSPTRDFVIVQPKRKSFPLRLAGRQKGKKRRGTITAGVAMRHLATIDQNACKGAKLRFNYVGTARRPAQAQSSAVTSGSVEGL